MVPEQQQQQQQNESRLKELNEEGKRKMNCLLFSLSLYLELGIICLGWGGGCVRACVFLSLTIYFVVVFFVVVVVVFFSSVGLCYRCYIVRSFHQPSALKYAFIAFLLCLLL